MSLSSILPAPLNPVWDRDDERHAAAKGTPSMGALVSAKISAPPYGQRRGWIPRNEADFGDGGAFPEIHVAQHPLGNINAVYTLLPKFSWSPFLLFRNGSPR
jgi:SNW domain-containing protein 1